MSEHQPASAMIKSEFTAVIKLDGAWWIGWIEEVPGVNCQEASRDKLIKSLPEALHEALEFNCDDAWSVPDILRR